MAEIRTGFREILSNPRFYAWVQSLLGGSNSKDIVINDYIRPVPKMRLLDIGCGPAGIRADLPRDIFYMGFDASKEYIESARSRFGSQGQFFQEYVSEARLEKTAEFDLVMAIGVLHHLDDWEVRALSRLAYNAVRPGGRFLTIDPSFVYGQHWLARIIISKDRGQNIRTPAEYQTLIKGDLPWHITLSVRHDLLRVPYTHTILECRK